MRSGSAPPSQRNDALVVAAALPGGRTLRREFPKGVRVSVGRDACCHLVLPSATVSRRHVWVHLSEGGIEVQDISSGGCHVNGKHLHRERLLSKEERVELRVGPYLLDLTTAQQRRRVPEQRRRAHALLLERMNLQGRKLGGVLPPELREEVRRTLLLIVEDPELGIPIEERPKMAAELLDEALGLGPLEALLADEAVTEVMVVDPENIYAERGGVIELTGRAFTDGEAVRSAIERIVTPLGRRIDESSPLVDARLPDGSRVNAVIPPLALRGPCITI